MKLKVAVLFGGKSTEHEISIISAIQAIGYINKEKYDVIPVYMTKNNDFYVGDSIGNIEEYTHIKELLEKSTQVIFVKEGDKAKEYNTAFGAQAAAVCDYMILVGSVNSADIKKGAVDAGFDPEKIFVKNTFTEASALMYELDAGREKVILLENDLPDNYK